MLIHLHTIKPYNSNDGLFSYLSINFNASFFSISELALVEEPSFIKRELPGRNKKQLCSTKRMSPKLFLVEAINTPISCKIDYGQVP